MYSQPGYQENETTIPIYTQNLFHHDDIKNEQNLFYYDDIKNEQNLSHHNDDKNDYTAHMTVFICTLCVHYF